MVFLLANGYLDICQASTIQFHYPVSALYFNDNIVEKKYILLQVVSIEQALFIYF